MKTIAFVSIAVAGPTAASTAAIVLAPTRASLSANDFVSWGQFGPAFTSVPAPFSATSNLGMTVTGTPPVERRDQGTGWAGNFNPAEQLIFITSDSTLTLAFETPVSATGFNIQGNTYGPFTAYLQAFDEFNNSLGTFSVGGNSSGIGDGSAVFLGITSDLADLKSIAIWVPGSNGFSINEVGLNSQGMSPIPEPGSVLALGGLLASGLMIRRRKLRP